MIFIQFNQFLFSVTIITIICQNTILAHHYSCTDPLVHGRLPPLPIEIQRPLVTKMNNNFEISSKLTNIDINDELLGRRYSIHMDYGPINNLSPDTGENIPIQEFKFHEIPRVVTQTTENSQDSLRFSHEQFTKSLLYVLRYQNYFNEQFQSSSGGLNNCR